MAIEKGISKNDRAKAENIALPANLAGKPSVITILTELLALGYAVADADEGDPRTTAGSRFESRIDELLDLEDGKFLLTDHPAYGVNWLGYIRHLVGPVVLGKLRLEPRNSGRGVGDKSGKK